MPQTLAYWMEKLGALRDDDPDSFPERISACQQALKLVRREEQPEQWSWLHAEIGYCSMLIRSENPAENLRQAIEHCEQALEVYTSDTYFKEWMGTSRNLAIAYKRWTGGDRARNLDRAIELQEGILQACTLEKLPREWAQAHAELAYLYDQRLERNKADNLQAVIRHYQQTLKVWTRETSTTRWAQVHYNLGTTLFRLQRLGVNRSDHQEQAIPHFRAALEILTPDAHPKEWVKAQHNLALVYIDRQREDRAENFGQAIELLEAVTRVCEREHLAAQLAEAENALGLAYLQSIEGGRSETLERAIDYFKQALEKQEKVGPAEQKALTQHNLSAAYTDRLIGDRIENLEQAVEYGQAALKTINRCEHDASNRAMIETGLAGALWRLATHLKQQGRPTQAAEYLEEAIAHGEKVVSATETRSMPYRHAFACYNLANIYSDRIEGDRAKNQEQAIQYYERALEFYTAENFAERWANAHSDLGITYLERDHADRAESVRKAIEHFDQALEVFRPDSFPISTLRVARNLGNLYFTERQWKNAATPFGDAVKAAERLYQASLLRRSKEAELGEIGDLYRRTAYALARSDDLKGAVVAVERGRARLLSEALQRDRADLETLARTHPDLYERYDEAASEIADWMRVELHLGPLSDVDVATQMRKAYSNLNAAIGSIQALKGYGDLAALPDFDAVISAIQPLSRLVYLLTTPAGGLALIVRRDPEPGVKPVWLAKLPERKLRQRLDIWFNAYPRRAQDMPRWKETIRQVTRWMWDDLMEPLVTELEPNGHGRTVLVPTGLLAMLPLHAAWYPGSTGAPHYTLDRMTVAYTPSARALAHAQRIASEVEGSTLFAVDNPDGSLRYSKEEVTSVARHFQDPWIVQGKKATRNTALCALPECDVYHFSCHGNNDWEDPLKSRLWMYGSPKGVPLTVADLLALKAKPHARLAFLSACETGLIGTKLPDEVVGLASGFLQAGAAGVISTLWPVEEQSTALLVGCFYENWKDGGMEPPEALARAQQWLRDEAGGWWAHPFYWAGFTLMGI
jgi:CHAT domain-containing protein/tetratricopeptide (TPR) repeat protein